RHAADRLRIELAVANDAHAAFQFVHEYASIRQEQERIRVLQPFGDRHHANFVITGIESFWCGVHGRTGGLIASLSFAPLTSSALGGETAGSEDHNENGDQYSK